MNAKQLYDEYMITSMVAGFEPVTVEQASGCVIIDTEGREYLDCFSGIAVCNAGHGHPKIVDAAHRQLDKLIHCCTYDYYSPRAAELARKLAQITPGSLQKSFCVKLLELFGPIFEPAQRHADCNKYMCSNVSACLTAGEQRQLFLDGRGRHYKQLPR